MIVIIKIKINVKTKINSVTDNNERILISINTMALKQIIYCYKMVLP